MKNIDLIPLMGNVYSVRSIGGMITYGCLHCAGHEDFRALRSASLDSPTYERDGCRIFPTQHAAVSYLVTGEG